MNFCCHWKKVILDGAFSFWLVFFNNDFICSLFKVIKIKYTMVTAKSGNGKFFSCPVTWTPVREKAEPTQLSLTCLKLTMETLEQGVKYIQS